MSPAEELLKRRDDAYREELRRIGEAIGYGNAQRILGELWDEMLMANYGAGGRGRMGVTINDGGSAQDLADEIKHQPDGYAYRYPDGIRFNNGREVNGSGPTGVIPFYYGTEQDVGIPPADAKEGEA